MFSGNLLFMVVAVVIVVVGVRFVVVIIVVVVGLELLDARARDLHSV